ncbi:MAG: EAL domain-containing protein [Pseudomonadota bacterium]
MESNRRRRVIVKFVSTYMVAALAWIFLSDRLLAVFVDLSTLLWMSTAKGVFFVLVSGAGFALALGALPPARSEALAGAVSGALPLARHSRLLHYGFALALTLAMLVMRHFLQLGSARPMVILLVLPIILSALLGGLGPGLLATALAALGVLAPAFRALDGVPLVSRLDWMQWSLLVLNGGLVSLLSDMLHRALARADIHRRLLDSVVSGTTDAIFVKDLAGRYQFANAAAAAFIGKSAAEIVGRDDTVLMPAASARIVLLADQAVLRSVTIGSAEELLTMNGVEKTFLVTKGPVFDDDGVLAGVFGVARDISARKRIEEALLASEAAMREAQALAKVASWEWAAGAEQPVWSEHGARPAFTPAGWDGFVAAARQARLDGQPFCFDAEGRAPEGDTCWLTVRGRAEPGAARSLRGTLQDITERKRIELRLQKNEARLQMVIEATSDSLWDWDLASGVLFQTANVYALTGLAPGDDSHDLAFFTRPVHPDDLGQLLRHLAAHRRGESAAIDIDYRIVTQNGAIKWIKAKGRVGQRKPDGTPRRLVGTLVDVTERKQFELGQREAATVFAHSHEGIMVVSPDLRVTKVNPAFEQITGYSAAEMLGRPPSKLSSGRHDKLFYQALWQAVHEQDFWRGEIWNRRKNGEVYPERLTISTVRDPGGAIQHYIAVFSDISQIKAHEDELNRVANYDTLTGAPNRRLLLDRFAQAIQRSARNGGSLAVCFLDLDGFKAVNDQYGHPAGDQLLIGVARHLNAVMRADDTLARLGGDEFVLLLSDVGTPEDCAQALDRILAAVGEPVCVEGTELRISASIGVSLYPADNVDADSLLRHADQAMYLAKESGKNRYHLFDPEFDRKAQRRRQFLERVALALLQDELLLYYQPKVDLNSGALVGAEALMRWNHPQRGVLAPGEFLPQIAGSRLERELGAWVIDTALAQMALWSSQGLQLSVSVNISAEHLLHPDFYDQLALALARFPTVLASHFELEVLETAAISDMEQAIAVLERCRGLGVGFALDDFGTGYSSLTYLRKLPVDTLKVDQSFVRDMLVDKDDHGIVEGVIQLARAFRRKVVAEGVETQAHGEALLALGCHVAQGYGIARPMPAGLLQDWARQWGEAPAWPGRCAPAAGTLACSAL